MDIYWEFLIFYQPFIDLVVFLKGWSVCYFPNMSTCTRWCWCWERNFLANISYLSQLLINVLFATIKWGLICCKLLPDQKGKISPIHLVGKKQLLIGCWSIHNMLHCHVCGILYYLLYTLVVLSGECDLKMQNVMFSPSFSKIAPVICCL